MPKGKRERRKKTAATAAVAIFVATMGGKTEPPFSAEDLARLRRGEVLIRHVEKAGPDETISSRLVAAVLIWQPEEVIWEVLNHPEREVEWLPGVKQSRLISDECPTPTTRKNVTDYRLSAFGLEAWYSLVREYDYEHRTIKAYMNLERPHRFFTDIQAGWDFFPYENGIIFQYWSESRLVIKIPAFISETMAEHSLAAGAAAIRERCNQIAAELKEHPAEPLCEGKR